MVASLVTFYSFNCILCLRSHSLLQVLYFDNNYKGYLFNQKISHQFYCIAKTCWENMIKNVDIWNHVQMLIVYWHKLTLFRYNKPDSLYMWKCVCVCARVHTHERRLSHIWLFASPWTAACQAPLSMEFSRQKILEWVSISYSRIFSPPRDWTCISWASCTDRRILYHWGNWETHGSF